MQNFEKSILIYLLDALAVSPNKVKELIDIVDKNDYCAEYHIYLNKLKLSTKDNLLLIVKEIRSELR